MEEKKEVIENAPKKKKKKWIVIILLLLLLIAAVGGGIWYFNRSKIDDTTKYWFDKMAEDGTLEGKTPAELQSTLNKIAEAGLFNVTMNVEPVFEDGKSEGTLGLENIDENGFYCRVELYNDKDQALLYKSEGLKPGQYIKDIKLAKELPAGQYPATAKVIVTDPETLDDVGIVNIKVNISVLK